MRNFFSGFIVGILVLAVGGALAAWLYPWRVNATDKPPTWERRLMNRLLDRIVEREAESLTSPVAVSDSALAQGLKDYRDKCAGCHGDYKKPSDWGMNNFYPRAPQFSRRNPHDPDNEIYWIVKNGIRYTGMAAWDKILPDDRLWKVSMFVTRMDSLPPAVANEWRNPPPPPGPTP